MAACRFFPLTRLPSTPPSVPTCPKHPPSNLYRVRSAPSRRPHSRTLLASATRSTPPSTTCRVRLGLRGNQKLSKYMSQEHRHQNVGMVLITPIIGGCHAQAPLISPWGGASGSSRHRLVLANVVDTISSGEFSCTINEHIALTSHFYSFPSFPPPNVSSPLRARPVLPRPEHTKYRISLSLDGKAGVVSTIPSPPRAVMPPPSFNDIQSSATIRRFGLQRSQSASSPVTLPPLSLLTNSLSPRADNRTYPQPPPLRRGRSRDVHAWESCADMETREDTLTEQAKHESNGSAIAAISLLRSTSSSGSPLQPSNSTKRNAAMARTTPRPDQTKKPRLTTVLGSAIKLQCDFDLMEKRSGEKEIANTEKSKLVLSGNDSDKENWSPGEDGSPRFSFSRTQRDASLAGRRPLPTGTAGPDRKPRRTPARNAQGEIGPLLSRANTVPANMWAQRGGKSIQPPLKIFEDARESGSAPTGADDDEVERFMRGEVSPSKKGDVDAVAGLLSLSQGNWR